MSRWLVLGTGLLAVACAKHKSPAAMAPPPPPSPIVIDDYIEPPGYYPREESAGGPTVDEFGMPVQEYDAPMAPAAAPAAMDKQDYAARSDRGGGSKPGKSAPADPDGAVSSPVQPEPPPPDEPAQAEPAKKSDRMVHYTGWARLRVTKIQETLDALAALAEARGGRVERLAATSITVRVPVATFDESWRAALALGDVLEKSVGAEDVTDAFLAVDLRVKTLRITLDRLVVLLAKAQTEEEKLTLLREIQRVTEELDRFETQLRTLRGLADFSTITVELVPREAVGAGNEGPDVDGFGWIRALSPFRRDVGADARRVELDVPAGMVALSPRGRFVAESPEGAALWTGRIVNDPRADATFWVEAIADRLDGEFAAAEPLAVGDWACLRLVDGSDDPYSWEVCVRGTTADRWIELAQAHYPDDATYARYGADVRAALAGGDGVAAGGR